MDPLHFFVQIYNIQYCLMNKQIKEAGEALRSLEDYFYLKHSYSQKSENLQEYGQSSVRNNE